MWARGRGSVNQRAFGYFGTGFDAGLREKVVISVPLRPTMPVLLALRRNKEDNARIPSWAFSISAADLL